MAERIERLGFPGILLRGTTKETGNSLPGWFTEMYFDFHQVKSMRERMKYRQAFSKTPEYLYAVDLTWSVTEYMRLEEAIARCSPLVADVLRAADERKISRKDAHKALIAEGGYELAGLPEDIIQQIEKGRVDVMIFGKDRTKFLNADRRDICHRTFKILDLLPLFRQGTNMKKVREIPKDDQKWRYRKPLQRGVALRAGSRDGDNFESLCYFEQPMAEKRGLLLVLPALIVWNMGSVAFGDLAWTQPRFVTGAKTVDEFFERPEPEKKEASSESKADEEEADDEDDDPTPDPDVDMEDNNPSSETSATAN